MSLFTSESVAEGHPDKLADQVSDAVLDISLAHRLARRLAQVRHDRTVSYLRPDGKVQVTVEYGEGGPVPHTIVISAQHHDEVKIEDLRADLAREVIQPVLGRASESVRTH